jgi:uncharacterized protein (DUF1778 family)
MKLCRKKKLVSEAACLAAQDALLDRTMSAVSPEVYARFVARLESPAKPNARLRRSLQTAAPWEK